MRISLGDQCDGFLRRTPLWVRRWIPFALLGGFLAIVVLASSVSPPIPDPIPLPRLPIMDREAAKEQREGFWSITEMWTGQTCDFSLAAQKHQAAQAGTPSPMMQWTAHITKDLLEVTSCDHNAEYQHDKTEWVYVCRFDPEGQGTVDFQSIPWDGDKEQLLKRVDEGHSHKGRYAVNGKSLGIYIPGDPTKPRPESIPKTLAPGDRRLQLVRYTPDEQYWVNATQICELTELPGEVIPGQDCPEGHVLVRSNERVSHYYDKNYLAEIKSTIEPFQGLRPDKRFMILRHTSGWIVQAVPPTWPQPAPAGNPVLKFLRNAF